MGRRGRFRMCSRVMLVRFLKRFIKIGVCLLVFLVTVYIVMLERDYSRSVKLKYRHMHLEESIETLQPDIASNLVSEVRASHRFHYASKCAPHPHNYNIKFSNTYWQVLTARDWTLFFFSAYYDNREHSGDYIRILTMSDIWKAESSGDNSTLWCQMWSTKYSDPKFSKVEPLHLIWPENYGHNTFTTLLPYILSCKIPEEIKQDSSSFLFAVSIVRNKCDAATNKLKVNFEFPPEDEKREQFTVCVKGLDFPETDISLLLIEWIELLKIMGVHTIHFYEFALHHNVKRVLNYYIDKEVVDVTPITIPGFVSNDPILRHDFLRFNKGTKRRHELIAYNDCFFRNMFKYDYIVLLDIDEIIVPVVEYSWGDMMRVFHAQIINKGEYPNETAFYGVGQTGCFFKGLQKHVLQEVPPYMEKLQLVFKDASKRRRVDGIKGFANPRMVFSMLNHNPRKCINNWRCMRYTTWYDDAQLQHYKHYKHHCGGSRESQERISQCDHLSCQHYLEDKTIWKYTDALVPRVKRVLEVLGLESLMDIFVNP